MVKGWNRKIRSTMAISRAKKIVLTISIVSSPALCSALAVLAGLRA